MSVVLFIVIILVLVVGHEAGHLIAAKLCRMRVPEFGIGFPPRLWGKKVGGTEYTVNALPFGGFVKIHGEERGSADPDSFSAKPALAQAATLLAGPVMNFALASVLLALAFMIGVPAVAGAYPAAEMSGMRVAVTEVLPGSPAEKAGIRTGDTVTALSVAGIGHAVSDPKDLPAIIGSATGPVTISLVRDGTGLSLSVVPETGIVPDAPGQRALGVATDLVGTVRLPLLPALAESVRQTAQETVSVVVGVWTLLVRAFTLSGGLSGVAGPIGIASLAGSAARFGAGAFLSFAALVSVNLGVLNLFPFPALDGGRLALLAVESVVRKRVPERFANAWNMLGFALLVALMIAVTVHDISRLG